MNRRNKEYMVAVRKTVCVCFTLYRLLNVGCNHPASYICLPQKLLIAATKIQCHYCNQYGMEPSIPIKQFKNFLQRLFPDHDDQQIIDQVMLICITVYNSPKCNHFRIATQLLISYWTFCAETSSSLLKSTKSESLPITSSSTTSRLKSKLKANKISSTLSPLKSKFKANKISSTPFRIYEAQLPLSVFDQSAPQYEKTVKQMPSLEVDKTINTEIKKEKQRNSKSKKKNKKKRKLIEIESDNEDKLDLDNDTSVNFTSFSYTPPRKKRRKRRKQIKRSNVNTVNTLHKLSQSLSQLDVDVNQNTNSMETDKCGKLSKKKCKKSSSQLHVDINKKANSMETDKWGKLSKKEYTKQNSAANGHCFMNSTVGYAEHEETGKILPVGGKEELDRALALRSYLVTYIGHNKDIDVGYGQTWKETIESELYKDFYTYLSDMRQMKSNGEKGSNWAGTPEIIACSMILNRSIYIFVNDNDGNYKRIGGKYFENAPKDPITLFWNGVDHYSYLIHQKQQKEQTVKKEKKLKNIKKMVNPKKNQTKSIKDECHAQLLLADQYAKKHKF